MPEPLLRLQNVTAGYGEAVVLDDISLDVHENTGLALLGRNGVGKSTLIQTVMGFTQMRSGQIFWRGQDITRVKPYLRARMGLGWVPQERDIFASLSVDENLTTIARPGDWTLERIYDFFPRLAERKANRGNQLSGGEQQMLAIARTLMTNPAILLLDEPMEGLAPIIVEEITAAIGKMMSEGNLTTVLVEQHADMVLSMSDEAIILERGRIAHSAPAAELRADHATLERYIGLKIGAE